MSTVREGSKTYLKCVIKDVDLGYDPFKRVFDTGWLSVTNKFIYSSDVFILLKN